jgi:hypothetical protein
MLQALSGTARISIGLIDMAGWAVQPAALIVDTPWESGDQEIHIK